MYVIPPAADGTTITEAMLTATSVPETPPTLYAGGTTYALGQTASVAASGNAFDVYGSLQNGNTGHAPASSPLWWKLLGRTYGVYSGATSYAANDRVIDPVAHKTYKSLVSSNDGNALSDGTKWLDEGPTNRWAALDLTKSTGTTAPSPLVYEITPGKRVNAYGFSGVIADNCIVQVEVGGEVVWTHTEKLRSRVVLGWYDWLTKPFSQRKAASRNDMPMASGAKVKVTFNRSAGDVTIGALFVNRCIDLGELEVDPDDDAQNFSTFQRNIEGTASDFIARRVIPLIRLTSFARAKRLPEIREARELLRATPAFWAGLDDSDNPYFESVQSVGVWKRFKLTPGHPNLRIDTEIEEA